MKNKICYSPKALEDLDEIWNYIVSELCNQDAAEQTVGRIMDVIDNLETFPEMGAIWKEGLCPGSFHGLLRKM